MRCFFMEVLSADKTRLGDWNFVTVDRAVGSRSGLIQTVMNEETCIDYCPPPGGPVRRAADRAIVRHDTVARIAAPQLPARGLQQSTVPLTYLTEVDVTLEFDIVIPVTEMGRLAAIPSGGATLRRMLATLLETLTSKLTAVQSAIASGAIPASLAQAQMQALAQAVAIVANDPVLAASVVVPASLQVLMSEPILAPSASPAPLILTDNRSRLDELTDGQKIALIAGFLVPVAVIIIAISVAVFLKARKTDSVIKKTQIAPLPPAAPTEADFKDSNRYKSDGEDPLPGTQV